MRGLHPYALMLGVLIGLAVMGIFRVPILAIVAGIGGTIAINETMKKRYLEARRRDDSLNDKRTDKRDDL